MKKFCPFCDSELTENLWCQQCQRRVILYNAHAVAPDKSNQNSGPERGSDTASCGNAASDSERPKRDTPKLVLLCSLFAVCVILSLSLCVHFIVKRESSDVREAQSGDNASGNAEDSLARRSEDSGTEPGEPHNDDESFADPVETGSNLDEPFGETPTEEAPAATGENPTGEDPAEIGETDTADWQALETLTPTDLQIYGDTKYYYYAAEDIAALGLQCTYYHLAADCGQAEAIIQEYLGTDIIGDDSYDDAFFNSYVDSGTQYYTTFQKILSFDNGDIQCQLNYDTGSSVLHYVSFMGPGIENYAELILDMAELTSPECTITADELRKDISDAADTLSRLESPDIWQEEYVYQDSHISIAMTYDEETYQLQISSIQYATDAVQGTLSISRPKR